jgi:hypothetical protein
MPALVPLLEWEEQRLQQSRFRAAAAAEAAAEAAAAAAAVETAEAAE